MKNCLSITVVAVAMFSVLMPAHAQQPLADGLPGGQVYEPAAFQTVQADLFRAPFAWPGRVWVSGQYADQGLGYVGSYVTLGAKTRLCEDWLDGRWLSEIRTHVSENGGFFANVGFERIFTIDAADADISVAGWFDYDDDQKAYQDAERFTSWGVTGQIKTPNWDLIANGYFPFGDTEATVGDPTGNNTFFENRIIVLPGIDSALQGFDVTLRTRPRQLAFLNGAIDYGGYGYESDLVDFFGGGRVRLMTQFIKGWIFTGELNYDDRFKVTGFLGLTYVWGGGARGSEYAGLACDLERTPRNDHIVRFNQDVVYAIDPDTGAPYNVIHVDNTADSGTANGTFENPYTNLVDAENAGMDDDIIFVDDGDGTTAGYEEGIALRDGQLLLGDGVQQLIPIQNGQLFELSNDQDGLRPVITATNNGSAVELASRNTVRGFVIDGDQSVGGMANGISGSGGFTNTDGIIEDNIIFGAILDGVGVTNLAGDWTFARNDIQFNGFNGIRLEDACDPTSIFNFDSNVASNNGLDGIQITNYIAQEINFFNNVTDLNGRDGVRLQDFKGDPLVGVNVLFDEHTARFNNGVGINVIDGAGSLTIRRSVIGTEQDNATGISIAGGNLGHGISIVDFVTNSPSDRILIIGNDIIENGIGAGAGINLELNEGTTRALITGNQVDANGIGLLVNANDSDPMNGVTTTMDVQVVDNASFGSNIFGGNVSDGMRFISTGGASLNLLIDESDGAGLLPILNNGTISGNGITFLVGDDSNGNISNLTAIIRDVAVNGSSGDGISGTVVGDGQLQLLFENSTVNGNADGFDFNFDTNETQAINSIAIRNVTADNNAFSGFSLNTGPGTYTDVSLVNNLFTNSALANAGIRPTGVGGPGFGSGVVINAIGDAAMGNPQVDNRTRLFVQGNTIDLYTFDGLAINTTGDASVLATIDGNTITNNGDGVLIPGNTQPDLPFFDGIALTATGSSSIDARISNNLVTGNAERGVDILTAGESEINVAFSGNNLALNDFAEDPNNDPIVDSFLEDFRAINGVGSQVCLSFSNNFFVLPDLLLNGGAFGSFVLELDGLTNGGFGVPLPPGITAADFGSTCEPAIAAEEMAFLADGFPPSPPPVVEP